MKIDKITERLKLTDAGRDWRLASVDSSLSIDRPSLGIFMSNEAFVDGAAFLRRT